MIAPSVIFLIRRMLDRGASVHDICREAEVSRMTVKRVQHGKLTAPPTTRCRQCGVLIYTTQCQLCLARRPQRAQ